MTPADQYQAIIIGSGQGGTPLAAELAAAGWRTALIEREHIGGTCVNEGCTPTKTMVASAEYNNWAVANGRPIVTVDRMGNVTGGPGRPTYDGINAMVNAYRNTKGVLPNDFFSITLPANFATQQATSYDITQPQEYKLFRLRQAFNTGFGGLYSPSENSRYIQLGLKIFF